MRYSPAALALGLLIAALVLPHPALAQDADQPVSVGTYWRCDQSMEARADEIIQEVWVPVMEKHMSAGHLEGYGYLAHWVGGEWRRLSYLTASDLNSLLDIRDVIIEELIADNSEALDELTAICPSHDDYIWINAGGGEATEPAAEIGASFGTYYICDFARESRADTLVLETFAPIMNRHLSADELSSWSWLQHWVGGKYRRLWSVRAADHKTAVAGRDAIEEEMFAQFPAEAEEFSQICNSHTDYMWNIQVSETN